MASFRKKGKVWYFRYVDAEGVKRERKGCSDRRATEGMAAQVEADAGRVRSGLADPADLAFRGSEARPLADHAREYRAALLAKGGGEKHANQTLNYVLKVAGIARADRLGDLIPSRVQGAIAGLREAGSSHRTCNAHLVATKGFSRWLWRDGRARADALVGLSGYNANEDRRHDRRTLGLDDLRAVVEAARRGGAYRGMSGPDRALLYRLAVATGLRYSGIKSITPGSFDLAAAHPTVTVAAGYTKNGETAVLPLPADVAADLGGWLAAKPAERPVFNLPEAGAAMLRVDLKAAGIPYRDSASLVFDFHALRCQCATLADAAGISPRVVQRLMRHSTLELTGRYTRPRMVDIEGAAAALPDLRSVPPTAQVHAATGTEGQPIGNLFSPHLPTGGDGSGRIVSAAGGTDAENEPTGPSRNSLPLAGLDGAGRPLSATGGNAPRRTRTYNKLIKSQLLYQLS